MAIATVPNVGSLVSFVCGQAAALVEKSVNLSLRGVLPFSLTSFDRYEFFKTNLELGRTIAKLPVAAMSKGGGNDPIRCVHFIHT